MKFGRKRHIDKVDEMIAESSLGTLGARELAARTERERPGLSAKIVRRVNELTDGKKTMSVAENAGRIKENANCDAIRAVLAQLVQMAYDKTEVAADALGEQHPGNIAIEGQAARIEEVSEAMTEAIGLLEFTMNNVADQLMGGTGG